MTRTYWTYVSPVRQLDQWVENDWHRVISYNFTRSCRNWHCNIIVSDGYRTKMFTYSSNTWESAKYWACKKAWDDLFTTGLLSVAY